MSYKKDFAPAPTKMVETYYSGLKQKDCLDSDVKVKRWVVIFRPRYLMVVDFISYP